MRKVRSWSWTKGSLIGQNETYRRSQILTHRSDRTLRFDRWSNQTTWIIPCINHWGDWTQTLKLNPSTWARIWRDTHCYKTRASRSSWYVWIESLVNEIIVWNWQVEPFEESLGGKRQGLETSQCLDWRVGVKIKRWVVVAWGVAWNALELILRIRSSSISSHLKSRTRHQSQRTKDLNTRATSLRDERSNGLNAIIKQLVNGALHGEVQCWVEETNDWEWEHC